MRSTLLSSIAARPLSDEQLGTVVGTPPFRVLYKVMNARGPSFWFLAVAVFRILLFVIVSWVVALRERARVRDVDAGEAMVLTVLALVNHRDPQGQ